MKKRNLKAYSIGNGIEIWNIDCIVLISVVARIMLPWLPNLYMGTFIQFFFLFSILSFFFLENQGNLRKVTENLTGKSKKFKFTLIPLALSRY